MFVSNGAFIVKKDIVKAFRSGWRAAKANAVPMVVLWCLAAATVAAYYLVPGVAAAFEPLMRWQVESGWVAAFLNRFVFAGLLPGVFMLSLPHLRAPVRQPSRRRSPRLTGSRRGHRTPRTRR